MKTNHGISFLYSFSFCLMPVCDTAKNYVEACKHQFACAQRSIKMHHEMKENWVLPVIRTICSDLRLLAQKCEQIEGSHISKPNELLEKTAEFLMELFRAWAAENR